MISANGARVGDNADVATRTPYSVQRQQAILTALRSAGRVDVADMAAELGVTGESIRKDLISLERQGLLRRVHGGAVAIEQLSFEPDVSHRIHYVEEKQRIAHAALAHLPQSGSVLLDAGSTTSQLAQMFPGDRELTIFTNTLSIAVALLPRPNLKVYTLGGRVRGRTLAEVDDWTLRSLSEINVDIAFFGANGISIERGLTTPDPSEAAVKRAMLACARRRVLLADHSKFGLVSTFRYGDPTDIDLLITDTGVAPDDLVAIRNAFGSVEQA
jgi:DeoR family transcriptional regulator, fructose operon transcriptional repressor